MKTEYLVCIFTASILYLSTHVRTEYCQKPNFELFDDDYRYRDIDICTRFMYSYSESVNMKMSLIDYLLEYIPQTYVHNRHLQLLTEYEKNYTFILASTVDSINTENENHSKNKYQRQTDNQFENRNHADTDDAYNGWQYTSINWDQSNDKIIKDITNKFDIINNCNSIITFYLTFPSYPENELLSNFFKQFQNTLNQTNPSYSVNDKDNFSYRNNIHPSFLSFIDSLPLIIFRQLLQQWSNVRFIFCGHGLGGTVAQLSTLHLLSAETNVLHPSRLRSISMGSLFFAQEETMKFTQNHHLQEHFINIHHEMDIVPFLFNIANLLSRLDHSTEQENCTKSTSWYQTVINFFSSNTDNQVENNRPDLTKILSWLCSGLTTYYPNLSPKVCEPSNIKITVNIIKKCLDYFQNLPKEKRTSTLIYQPIGIFSLITFREYDYTWHLINVLNAATLYDYLSNNLKRDLSNEKQIFANHSISTYMMDFQRCNQQKPDLTDVKKLPNSIEILVQRKDADIDKEFESNSNLNYSVIIPLPFRFSNYSGVQSRSGVSYMDMIALSPVFPSETFTSSSSNYHNLKRRFLSALKHSTGLSKFNTNNKNKKPTTMMSIYDICLTIYETFGIDARMELMKLQLDQRMLVPILVSNKKTSSSIVPSSYSPAFRSYINTLTLVETAVLQSKENILTMDSTLLRIGLISTIRETTSGLPDFIHNVFQVTSIRQPIYGMGKGIKVNIVVETGYGFLSYAESAYRPVILVHIIGDYRPLMSFLAQYVDALIVEYNEDDKSFASFDYNPHLHPLRIQRIMKWKHSINAEFDEIKQLDEPYLMEEFEGSVTAVTVPFQNNLREILLNPISSVESSSLSRPRLVDLIQDNELFNDDDIPMLNIEILFKDIKTDQLKKIDFQLQQSYNREAVSHIKRDNPDLQLNHIRKQELDENIRQEWNYRLHKYKKVGQIPIINSFISIISEPNDEKRYIQKRQFESALSQINEETTSLIREKKDEIFREMQQANTDVTNSNGNTSTSPYLKQIAKEIIEKYYNIKKEYIDASLSPEHFWRELSHLYLADKNRYRQLPDLAAQHMIDGFSLELLDGDSMLLNIRWIEDVFDSLSIKLNNISGHSTRILTLAICGVQSSGKSSLLKTMFGIRLRTSVGACTQGVNMILVKASHPDYDYVLLLDTEGLRAPEFNTIEGVEMRDNTLASFAVLPADGTILLNKGEVNQALEEVFPVVLYLYATSSLSKMLGGEVPSKLFFVYNQIDLSQSKKGIELLQDLITRLNNVTHKIIQAASTQHVPFHGFQQCRLDLNNISNSDFSILPVNVNNPPINEPAHLFGEKSLQLRQWIDHRITDPTNNRPWKARSISDIAQYFKFVSEMIRQSPHIASISKPYEIWANKNLLKDIEEIMKNLSLIYNDIRTQIENQVVYNYTDPSSANRNLTLSSDAINYIVDRSHEKVLDLVHDSILQQEEKVREIIKETRRESHHLDNWGNFLKEINNQNRKILNGRIGLEIINFQFYGKTLDKIRKDFITKCNTINCMKLSEAEKKVIFEEILKNRTKDIPNFQITDASNVPHNIQALYNQSAVTKDVQIFDDTNQFCLYNGSSTLSIFEENSSKYFKQNLPSKEQTDRQQQLNKETRKLTELTSEIRSYIDHLIISVDHYESSIVNSVLEHTQKVLGPFIQSETKKAIHREIYCYLEYRLTEIQNTWDDKHNYTKLLRKHNESLWEFFNNVIAGVKGVKLFELAMFNAIKESWHDGFIDVLVQQIATEVDKQSWVSDSEILHAKMNREKIMILESEKDNHTAIDALLDQTHIPDIFYKKCIAKWIHVHISDDINHIWNRFYNNINSEIDKARDRAKTSSNNSLNSFLQILRNRETSALPFFISSRLPIDVSSFGNADNLTTELFDTMAKVLKKAVPSIQDPESLLRGKEAELIWDKIRANSARDSAKPRCNHACKMCGAPCFHHSDHSEHHDFHHQPAGLVGTYDVHTNKIAFQSCHESFKDGSNFTLDGTTFQPYSEFPRVLGYEVPHSDKRDLFGEYLMSKYHKFIADYYDRKPNLPVPVAYDEYSLDDIKKKIGKKLR